MKIPTPVELQQRGFDALVKELGYTGAVRFLWQYEAGEGDYTEERRELLSGWTPEGVAREEARLFERAPDAEDKQSE